jgi:hypothetical protein
MERDSSHNGYPEEIMTIMKSSLYSTKVTLSKPVLLLISPNPLSIGKGVGGFGCQADTRERKPVKQKFRHEPVRD